MNTQEINNWQAVQEEVRRRIHARDWKPGELIPNEADLAREFGCARATVNRALRTLADAGLLDRRRKAGTRVALHPVGKAVLDIPVIRQEIEGCGMAYSYVMLDRITEPAAAAQQARLRIKAETPLLHVTALHLADGRPYVLEDRWIDIAVVPDATNAPFDTTSANEWLLAHAPYTHGYIAFSAVALPEMAALALKARPAAAAFLIERNTWDHDRAVTAVDLYFAPGYRMQTHL